MSNNDHDASSSRKQCLHRLPKLTSTEARAQKEAYLQAHRARLRPSRTAKKVPRCSHNTSPILDCGECFGESVRGLPTLPLSLVLKNLSKTDFIRWEKEELHVEGPDFFKKARYAEHLQIALARRLGVITTLAITPYKLDYEGVATLITGDQLLSLVRLVGPKKRHQLS